MTQAARVDFEIRTNEDFRSPEISIENEDAVPRDLTDVLLRMQVKRRGVSPVLLDLTSESGGAIEILNPTEGRIRIDIDREAIDPGVYRQDLVEEIDGLRTVLWVGVMTVTKGVTRWS